MYAIQAKETGFLGSMSQLAIINMPQIIAQITTACAGSRPHKHTLQPCTVPCTLTELDLRVFGGGGGIRPSPATNAQSAVHQGQHKLDKATPSSAPACRYKPKHSNRCLYILCSCPACSCSEHAPRCIVSLHGAQCPDRPSTAFARQQLAIVGLVKVQPLLDRLQNAPATDKAWAAPSSDDSGCAALLFDTEATCCTDTVEVLAVKLCAHWAGVTQAQATRDTLPTCTCADRLMMSRMVPSIWRATSALLYCWGSCIGNSHMACPKLRRFRMPGASCNAPQTGYSTVVHMNLWCILCTMKPADKLLHKHLHSPTASGTALLILAC